MVNDNLTLHEIEESFAVHLWMNGRDLLAVRNDRLVPIFNHLVKVEILEVVDDADMVDELAVLAKEAVSASPVFIELFLDEWQGILASQSVFLGLLLEGDFWGDRRVSVFGVIFVKRVELRQALVLLLGSKIDELELEVLLVLTGHLLHKLIGDLLLLLLVVILHLLQGSLFEVGL